MYWFYKNNKTWFWKNFSKPWRWLKIRKKGGVIHEKFTQNPIVIIDKDKIINTIPLKIDLQEQDFY